MSPNIMINGSLWEGNYRLTKVNKEASDYEYK